MCPDSIEKIDTSHIFPWKIIIHSILAFFKKWKQILHNANVQVKVGIHGTCGLHKANKHPLFGLFYFFVFAFNWI